MVIFINQIRMKIGVMFGNPETTTGGNALKFYASVRLDIRRIGADQGGRGGGRQPDPRQGGEEQGGAALQGGRVRHHVRRGHLQEGELVDLGVKAGIVEKSGAWFAFNGERIGQGRENAKDYLKEHRRWPRRSSGRSARSAGLIAGKILEGDTRARRRGGARPVSPKGMVLSRRSPAARHDGAAAAPSPSGIQHAHRSKRANGGDCGARAAGHAARLTLCLARNLKPCPVPRERAYGA